MKSTRSTWTGSRCADSRPKGRPQEDPQGGRRGDVRIDPATQQVDDRARGRGDADHEIARGGGDPQRHTHHEVHQRHLDDPAADPQQRRDEPRRTGSRRSRCRVAERHSPDPRVRARPAVRGVTGQRATRLPPHPAAARDHPPHRPARVAAGLGRGYATHHRHGGVGKEERKEPGQDALGQKERDEASHERADRGEELQRHSQPQVGVATLEVDTGGRAARHDDADEARPDRLPRRQTEPEGQERDDEDPPPRPRSDPKTPAATPPAPAERDSHRRPPSSRRGHRPGGAGAVRRGQGRRCCGAYGSSATCRARLRATDSSRWCRRRGRSCDAARSSRAPRGTAAGGSLPCSRSGRSCPRRTRRPCGGGGPGSSRRAASSVRSVASGSRLQASVAGGAGGGGSRRASLRREGRRGLRRSLRRRAGPPGGPDGPRLEARRTPHPPRRAGADRAG